MAPSAAEAITAGAAGYNAIAFIGSEEERIITAGADTSIRVWDPSSLSADKGAEKELNDQHEDTFTALACSPMGDCFATGALDKMVKVFSFPELEFMGNVTRFTLPVRALAFSPTGGTLAAAGDEAGIKLVKMEDYTIFRTIEGVSYVKGLAYDPQGDFLASLTANGTLQVWSLDSGEAVFERKDMSCKVDFEGHTAQNHIQWSPDGDVLAVPATGGGVTLLRRGSWESGGRLRGEHLMDVHLVSFSPNGKYLASAAGDEDSGEVIVWDVAKRRKLNKHASPDSAVCSVAWRPAANGLAVFDADGQFQIWSKAVPSHLPPPYGDGEEDLDEAFADLADQLDNAKGGGAAAGSEDGGSGLDAGGAESDEDDGMGGGVRPSDASPYGGRPARSHHHLHAAVAPRPAGPAMQPAIQPGAGAADPLGRRFLAYDLVGSIVSKEIHSEGQAGTYRSIEVSFHDTTRAGARVPALSDYFGFTLGSLGPRGAAYAGPARAGNLSTVMYRPFESWAANSDWQAELPPGEDAVAVAAGEHFVAVATSAQLLRVYSESGVPTAVIRLAGPAVTLAAQGDQLAAVWHAGDPTEAAGQCLEYMLVDVPDQRRVHGGRLPATKGATLVWVGFSETGLLAASDSSGVVSVRCHEFGGSWVPVFSTARARKSEGEVHWVVGLTEHEVYCVIVRAPSTSPGPVPRPVLSILPLGMPLAPPPAEGGPTSPSDELEEKQLRAAVHLSQLRQAAAEAPGLEAAAEHGLRAREVELDKATLKLFTQACKADRLARALELGSMLSLNKSLQGAIRMANQLRLLPLSERLTLFLQNRMDLEAQQQAEWASQGPAPAGYATQHEAAPPPAAGGARADPFSHRHKGDAAVKIGQPGGGEGEAAPKATGLAALKEKLQAGKENAAAADAKAEDKAGGQGAKRKAGGANPFAKRAAKA